MDVDIDVANIDLSKIFKNSVRASLYKDKKLSPHPCGVYFQDISTDPITGLAAIPYQQAEELNYFKIDFLHLYVYDHFTSRKEIKELLKHEPDWSLLKHPSVVAQCFQISKHYDLISEVAPKSVVELADCLALIRPQKRYLKKYYLENPSKFREDLYSQEASEQYAFKKAHSISYALVIVLQLHLIKGGVKF